MSEQKISLDYSEAQNLRVKLSGDWLISGILPATKDELGKVDFNKISRLSLDAQDLGQWDSALVAFLFHLIRECRARNIAVDWEKLPPGAKKLLALALKDHQAPAAGNGKENFFIRVTDRLLGITQGAMSLLDFLGQIASSATKYIRGRANFRRDEFLFLLQSSGADALLLISLISVLVGIILAFIGANQLKIFGAEIYIANAVGIGMVRAMGAMMAAILMAGRTGASYAAELGLMQTNEEIDALRTLGISPVEFLVIPRILALVIMLPLLTLYADLMGIFGGFLVGISLLRLNPVEYWQHTQSAVTLSNLWVGLTHALVFGIIIGIAGCYRGLRCSRSASAVGEAATKAVVSAVISIVIATAIITFICHILGI